MKKSWLAGLLLIVGLQLSGATPSLTELRSGLKKAGADEDEAVRFLELLKCSEPKTPLLKGYIAATEGLLAKHAFLPTTKYNWCKISLEHFRTAIAEDPSNLELRYLRLAVETALPKFLELSGDVPSDRNKALELLPGSKDRTLQRNVAHLLTEKAGCSEEEKLRIRNYMD